MATNDRSALERLIPPLYVVGLLFLVTPIVDVVTNVWPLRPAAAQWRYGSVGLAANYLISSVFGMLVVALAAAVRRDRTVLRVVAVASGLGAVALIVAPLSFVLDVLQLRNAVAEDALWTFKVGAAKAVFKYLAAALGFVLIGLAAWRGGRTGLERGRQRGEPALVRSGGS